MLLRDGRGMRDRPESTALLLLLVTVAVITLRRAGTAAAGERIGQRFVTQKYERLRGPSRRYAFPRGVTASARHWRRETQPFGAAV
jgi:hypothetical protein